MIEVDGHWQLSEKIEMRRVAAVNLKYQAVRKEEFYFCLIIGAQFLTLFYRQLLQYSVPSHSLFSIDNVHTICVHIIIEFLHKINACRCPMEVFHLSIMLSFLRNCYVKG